jgi:hypothetical protein
MGGMIAVRYAEVHPGEVAGLVLSGPVIGTWTPVTELLGYEVIPSDPLDITTLSRDEEVGRVYSQDPYVWHGPFKRRTALGLMNCLLDIALDADKVTGPVLWQHGEADQLVPLAGSRRGMTLLRNADVTELTYPGARHEIFNETNKDEVLADTASFLDRLRTWPAWPVVEQPVQVKVVGQQDAGRLGEANPGVDEQANDRGVARGGEVATVARPQQAAELVVGQHRRRLVRELGRLHAHHRAVFEFAFGEAPLEERLQAPVAVQGGRRLPPLQLVGDEIADVGALDRVHS